MTSPGLRSAQGFTLIEVMVVVLIIGILVTFATLSVGNRTSSDQLDTEAHRLDQLFQLAQEQAELNGQQYGFRYTDSDYAFMAVGKDGNWTPIADGPLRARPIPPPLEIRLHIEGNPVPPAQDGAPKHGGRGQAPSPQPQILILSSGELTDFELDLSAAGISRHYRLTGNVVGALALAPYDPDHPT